MRKNRVLSRESCYHTFDYCVVHPILCDETNCGHLYRYRSSRIHETSKTMFTTTSRYVKRLDVSTLQSRIRTIVVIIPLNKMFCLFIFFILVPNFLLGYFNFFSYFVWTTTSKFFEFLFECFLKFEILVQNFFSLKWFPLGTQYTMYLLGIRFIFSTCALKCPFWK